MIEFLGVKFILVIAWSLFYYLFLHIFL